MTTYVLESHPLMCQAITLLLRRIDPSKKVIAVHAYSKLQEAMLINGHPEAFIMDPLITGINGTAGIKKIKSIYPNTPLILFSSIPSEEAESPCLSAGADMYIEKTESPQRIFELIRNHLNWTNNSSVPNLKAPSAEGLIILTKRQKQLVPLIDSGFSNENIALELNISARTVKVHLWRLYKKLGINSRTQLVKLCRDNGYL
jgi:DNA-binding NarL/FixJ family response regulator